MRKTKPRVTSITIKTNNDKTRTDIIDGRDAVVVDVERIEALKRFEVAEFLDEVLLQVEASEFRLRFEVLDPPDSVRFEPQALEARVIVQVFDARVPCERQYFLQTVSSC